jgi:hypothetical protein
MFPVVGDVRLVTIATGRAKTIHVPGAPLAWQRLKA